MYSKVKLAGHPLHPMLVGFPVTLYVVTLVCFVAFGLGADPFWFRVAVYANIAGVVMALIAAIPGFIDWSVGVPTGSPAKTTGMAHMAFNVMALIVFAANAFFHWGQLQGGQPDVSLAVPLSLAGVGLTLIAGFLGWKMVQKHHVGVELTPEQERLEPRANPRSERGAPIAGEGHGRRVG
jgi:uncharacterized membrane protein